MLRCSLSAFPLPCLTSPVPAWPLHPPRRRTGGMALARSLLVLLLVLLGTRIAAADTPSVEQLKGGQGNQSSQVAGATDQPLIDDLGRRHDLTQLRGLSPVVGAALLLAAVIPLFAGWRLLRLALGLLVGVFA